MVPEHDLPALRARIAALVAQEAELLAQAFALSRAGSDRHAVEELFARVQANQLERQGLKARITQRLGGQRLHVAAEVWLQGLYQYRAEVGAAATLVRVEEGPLGLQVRMPGKARPVGIESLPGTFDGPVAADHADPLAAPGLNPAAERGPPSGSGRSTGSRRKS
jgi:hypothetical protein